MATPRLNPAKVEQRVLQAATFVRASGQVPDLNVGILDCSYPLGKAKMSAMRYFKLNEAKAPLAMTVSGGSPPKQIEPSLFRNSLSLAEYAAKQTKMKVIDLTGKRGTMKQLEEKCLNFPSCLVALSNRTLSSVEHAALLNAKKDFRSTPIVC